MELAPVYDLSAVNQAHFRHFQFLVQRDSYSPGIGKADAALAHPLRLEGPTKNSNCGLQADGIFTMIDPTPTCS